MMGSFLSRILITIFGYAYPAYECYKTVELNKPEIEQLRFWCQYWILVAFFSVFEYIGDIFISWLPMYSEAKIAFIIYLWYPKTKGTRYVYDTYLSPYISRHEADIDRNLLELRTRAGDVAIFYWQKIVGLCQSRIFEILQFVALQSKTVPRSTQSVQIQGHDQNITRDESPEQTVLPKSPLRKQSRNSVPVEASKPNTSETESVRSDTVSTSRKADDSKEKAMVEAVRKARARVRKRTSVPGSASH